MNIERFWKKVVLKNYAIASIVIPLLIIILVLSLKSIIPPQVPLFYALPVGEDQLTPYWGFLIAPGVSLLISIVNIAVSMIVEDSFYKKVLIISAFFISLLVLITVLKIIFLVSFF